MKLAWKTFFYSILLAVVIIIVITAYNIFLLPSLYVSYTRNQNRENFAKVHQSFVELRSYATISTSNPMASVSVIIPSTGYTFQIFSQLLNGDVTINNPDYYGAVDYVRNLLATDGTDLDFEKIGMDSDNFFRQLLKIATPAESDIQLHLKTNNAEKFFTEAGQEPQFYNYPNKTVVIENSVTVQKTFYTNFIGITRLDNETILSFNAVVTPAIDDIRPVMINSLPLTTAIVFLLSLLFSQLFSFSIISPILKLTKHAENLRNSRHATAQTIEISGGDEISQLGHSLNDLYAHLQRKYQELEEENRRQEVFLRSSSHELKTPIAAALLLVNSMIEKVGKFRNTDQYLPELRDQVKKMQSIVDEILSLNLGKQQIQSELIVLEPLIQSKLQAMQVQIMQKNLTLTTDGTVHASVYTDEFIMKKILSNLIQNAVENSPDNAEVSVTWDDMGVEIRNPGKIEESLLPHIFEPFVTGNSGTGHGLGLYVSAYYARLLGFTLSLENPKDQVIVHLQFFNNK